MSMAHLMKSLSTLSAAQAAAATPPAAAAPAADPAATTTTEADAAAAAAQAEQEAAAQAAAAAAAKPAPAAPAPAADPVVIGAGAGVGAATAAMMKAMGVDDLSKSITLELEGGEEVRAFDGELVLKALAEVIDQNATETMQALGQAVMIIGTQSGQIDAMSKSLTDATGLIQSQAQTIAELRADLDVVRNKPAGRISTTTAPVLQKSLENGGASQELPPQEFLAKCLGLQKDGLMTLQEVAIAEAAIGMGAEVPDGIRSKVFSTKP